MTQSKMTGDVYGEGYWERGEGSNYVRYGDDPGWDATVGVLQQHLPRSAVVYELASAKGYFVQRARTRGLQAYGVDISPHAIANAAPQARQYLTLGNAVSTPWSDMTADCVCSWEFLEHVPEDELDLLFDEMDRVAKPGALLVHRIGIYEGTTEEDLSNHLHDHTHVTNYPRDWWRQRFADRGYARRSDVENDLNDAFVGRDWVDRFFAYNKETG